VGESNGEIEAWNGSAEQKLWTLMRVWAEVSFNFVYFDQVPELDWDREIRKAIPSVLESENKNDCYRILQELVALLNDGHTFILPPMEELDSLDHPALEMQMVDGRVIITRTGDSKEITERELVSGLEVVEVDGRARAPWHKDWPRPTVETDDNVSWGLGWGLQRTPQGRSFWHWGDNNHYHSIAMGFPENGQGIVIMTNGANGQKLIQRIVREAIGGSYPGLSWLERVYNP